MANPTMTLIGTPVIVGSGGLTTVNFTSIPNTYTDLIIKASARAGSANWINISINGGSTTTNLLHLLDYNGTIYSQTYTPARLTVNGTTSNTFSNSELYFTNYTSSNNKSFSADNSAEANSTNVELQIGAYSWNSTSPITSITLTGDSGQTIEQYSTFYLYGIRNS